MNRTKERRIYPICCTSMSCGSVECEGCNCKPILDEFEQWVEDNNAKVKDEIWAPLVYYAS